MKKTALIGALTAALLASPLSAQTLGQGGGTQTVKPVPSTGTYTDRSLSIASGGVSQTLMAANAARKQVIIQNPCSVVSQGFAGPAESIFFSFVGVSNIAGSAIELAPCGSFDSDLGPMSTQAITVFATSTSHRVIAWELQ